MYFDTRRDCPGLFLIMLKALQEACDPNGRGCSAHPDALRTAEVTVDGGNLAPPKVLKVLGITVLWGPLGGATFHPSTVSWDAITDGRCTDGVEKSSAHPCSVSCK